MAPERVTILIDGPIELKPMIQMHPSSTIYQLINRLEAAIGIDAERLTLFSGTRKLRNSDTIGSALSGESFLRLKVEPLPWETVLNITVFGLTDYEEEFQVKEDDSVHDLKYMILASEDFHSKRIDREPHLLPKDLVLSRTEDVVMNKESFRLSRYCIHEGCKIKVELLIVREVEDEDEVGGGEGSSGN